MAQTPTQLAVSLTNSGSFNQSNTLMDLIMRIRPPFNQANLGMVVHALTTNKELQHAHKRKTFLPFLFQNYGLSQELLDHFTRQSLSMIISDHGSLNTIEEQNRTLHTQQMLTMLEAAVDAYVQSKAVTAHYEHDNFLIQFHSMPVVRQRFFPQSDAGVSHTAYVREPTRETWFPPIDPPYSHFQPRQPSHVTSVENAFMIIVNEKIHASPGKHRRLGEQNNVVYVGFPLGTTSTFGSVSFEISPSNLTGLFENVAFHYRYSMQYQTETSHLFYMCSQGATLPPVPTLPYTPNVEEIWTLTGNANDQQISFRKRHEFEFIEFALDVGSIPLNQFSGISFKKKVCSIPGDGAGLGATEAAASLLTALSIHFGGFAGIPHVGENDFIHFCPEPQVESLTKTLLLEFEVFVPCTLDQKNTLRESYFTFEHFILDQEAIVLQLVQRFASCVSRRCSDKPGSFDAPLWFIRYVRTFLLALFHAFKVAVTQTLQGLRNYYHFPAVPNQGGAVDDLADDVAAAVNI